MELTEDQKKLLATDISKLTVEQLPHYCAAYAQNIGLDPALKPFDILVLGGKRVLYANKGCASQLRELRDINLETTYAGFLPTVPGDVDHSVYIVVVKATMGKREETECGASPMEGVTGESRSNAIMKAHTKAKRRATLSICGLGIPDESELDSIPVPSASARPMAYAPAETAKPEKPPGSPLEALRKANEAIMASGVTQTSLFDSGASEKLPVASGDFPVVGEEAPKPAPGRKSIPKG